MKIILTKSIPNVGSAGDIKDVSTGYARNFLIKKGLALLATPQVLKDWQAEQERQARDTAKGAAELEKIADKISSIKLTIKAKANKQGRLFAGIDAKAIANELFKQYKLNINPNWLKLTQPIKQIGEVDINYNISSQIGKFNIAIRSS